MAGATPPAARPSGCSRDYPLEEDWGTTRIVREPVGVCALLAPWNWPMNQVTAKVAPALAAGCTMVLKPSQLSPLSALLFAEAVDEAGVPAGVFNMVNGAGAALGDSLRRLTRSSTWCPSPGRPRSAARWRAAAARRSSASRRSSAASRPTSCSSDVDVDRAVATGVLGCMHNSGQTCNAPTRMLVAAGSLRRGGRGRGPRRRRRRRRRPARPRDLHGPRRRAQAVRHGARATSRPGSAEGARLVAGGPGAPRRPRQGLLRAAHGVRRRDAGHAHLPRGDLRPGALP